MMKHGLSLGKPRDSGSDFAFDFAFGVVHTSGIYLGPAWAY